MDRVILEPREENRIERGHPWVFDNEIAEVTGSPRAGDVVDVESSRKTYLGRGFWNPHSRIRVRITTRSKDGIDGGYWMRRLKSALELRSRILDVERDSFRLAFGESDFLPGLIVDCFNATDGKRYLSCQFLSYGVDARKAEILSGLSALLAPAGIAERSDASVRELEGLAPYKGVASGEIPPFVRFRENGCVFETSLLEGQKTGWFLDQRENRAAAGTFAKGRACLDVCSNAGGFSVLLAAGGASSVEAVDSSESALELVRRNADINGFGGIVTTFSGDAFDRLRSLSKAGRKFALVVLDPPAFAKTKADVPAALRGYKDLNLHAMELLEPGGTLVTCSCSHHVPTETFQRMLADAARDAGKPLRILETRFQSKDHPVLAGYGESLYLKCVIAVV